MFIGELTLADALRQVQGNMQSKVREDVVEPTQEQVTKTGERYYRESPEYHDALFAILHVSKRRHTAVWEAVSLALENAFLRGNKASIEAKVYVRVFQGNKGWVVQIENEGEGFDFREKFRAWESGKEVKQGSGRGWARLHASPVLAGYEGKGNIMNIVILYENLE